MRGREKSSVFLQRGSVTLLLLLLLPLPHSPSFSSSLCLSECLFPFPWSRPGFSLPLLLLTLYFGSLVSPSPLLSSPSLLFLPSSPSVSTPQLLSSLFWSNIRSEPFVLFNLPSSLLPLSFHPVPLSGRPLGPGESSGS